MGLYRTETYSTTGTKGSLNADPYIAPFQLSAVCTLGSTGTYKLQFSLDPMTVTDANATWTDSVGIPSGTATSATTTFIGPISRVRAVITALGTTLIIQLLQGISTN